MSRLTALTILLALLMGCGPKQIEIEQHLDEAARAELMYELSRYLCHLAPGADHTTKFDSIHDSHYKTKANELMSWFYYPEANGKTFFLVCRIAPSIKEKYVATGGYFVRNNETSGFTEYAEVFRTWKDEKAMLRPKAEMLFQSMINGRDLSPYYTENAGTEYIEFPDSETHYDTEKRLWVSQRENPLQEMKDEAARALKEAGDAVREARSTDADSTAN